jgi:hypothetical protein
MTAVRTGAKLRLLVETAATHLPRGSAADITNADIEATLAKTAAAAKTAAGMPGNANAVEHRLG